MSGQKRFKIHANSDLLEIRVHHTLSAKRISEEEMSGIFIEFLELGDSSLRNRVDEVSKVLYE